ncbi:MAG: 3-deoxy-manno-octulosonate cytidylyltransferase [Pseudomonadota bacterium]
MSDFVVVIPARYASERLPGKPLRDIVGKPMIVHVHMRGMESDARETIIATDDERIAEAAEAAGATICMTSDHHRSGSERIAEVCDIMDWSDDVCVVNLQGDEPTMPPSLINQAAGLLDRGDADIGTLASPLTDQREFENPNVVKAVVDDDGFAKYFTRLDVLPDDRKRALQHHGIYAYRAGKLRQMVAAEPSELELREKLEQIRALDLGMAIRVGIPDQRPGPGVDTEEDLASVAKLL